MDQLHKFDLTKLCNNTIEARYSFGIVLLRFWGALDLRCVVQLHICIPNNKLVVETLHSQSQINLGIY